MQQLSFTDLDYRHKKRQTRREKFLARMDALIPWEALIACVEPYYPKGERGRKPVDLEKMLRVHCLQSLYTLSDPAMEDCLYEIVSMRHFAKLSLNEIPDETTILHFRHLLEKHQLGNAFFESINAELEAEGLLMKTGTIVDATFIHAPSSTKNKDKARDPEMRSGKKGNTWHFGMKLHIGTTDDSGLVHSHAVTGANEHDITATDKVLHGKEEKVYGDAGYVGVEKRDEHKEREVDWHILERFGKRKSMSEDEVLQERNKASIRAKVEHPFLYIKRLFGYDKTKYRGLSKNHNRLALLLGFFNLLKAEKLRLA